MPVGVFWSSMFVICLMVSTLASLAGKLSAVYIVCEVMA
jgi:hypothetical protein